MKELYKELYNETIREIGELYEIDKLDEKTEAEIGVTIDQFIYDALILMKEQKDEGKKIRHNVWC